MVCILSTSAFVKRSSTENGLEKSRRVAKLFQLEYESKMSVSCTARQHSKIAYGMTYVVRKANKTKPDGYQGWTSWIPVLGSLTKF